MHYIYKITNLYNGKVYIGQSKNPKKRWYMHCNKHGGCIKITRAIQKYGKDMFSFEVILECSVEDADSLESQCIWWFNSVAYGYNVCYFSNTRRYLKHTEETKAKMRNKAIGRLHSEETKAKISRIKSGNSKNSPSTRRKISESSLGHKKSLETRQKMSESRRGMTFSETHKQNLSKAKLKISPDCAEDIFNLYSSGNYTFKELSSIYGVSSITMIRYYNRIKSKFECVLNNNMISSSRNIGECDLSLNTN